MLELRPTCEHCERPLPPASAEAMVCSFDCTFCRDCVNDVLHGTCPNCGSGFVPRPIRPARDWVSGYCLVNHPARTTPVHRRVDPRRHATLLARLGALAPAQR